MVDSPGPVSLIHCGLDAWPFDETNPNHMEFIIDDEKRLLKRLGVKYLVSPPDFRLPYQGDDIRVCAVGGVRSDDNLVWKLAILNRHK